jgi:hypothetical protein
MAEIDIEQLRAARDPFVLVARGSRFVARPVSAECMRTHVDAAQSADPAIAVPALRALLRAGFPYRIAYWWRGDPVRLILDELDPPTQREVLRGFFLFLAGRPQLPSIPPSPPRSPSSPTPSAPAPATARPSPAS